RDGQPWSRALPPVHPDCLQHCVAGYITRYGRSWTSERVEMHPLQGVRVIEFCNVAAGPFCGMLLADMGADVIKVENPQGGDTMRQWPPINNGYSENFASLNRNKRSVTLDLKDPADRARART